MASNPDFVQYIIDQCSGAGEIAVTKMARTAAFVRVHQSPPVHTEALQNAFRVQNRPQMHTEIKRRDNYRTIFGDFMVLYLFGLRLIEA